MASQYYQKAYLHSIAPSIILYQGRVRISVENPIDSNSGPIPDRARPKIFAAEPFQGFSGCIAFNVFRTLPLWTSKTQAASPTTFVQDCRCWSLSYSILRLDLASYDPETLRFHYPVCFSLSRVGNYTSRYLWISGATAGKVWARVLRPWREQLQRGAAGRRPVGPGRWRTAGPSISSPTTSRSIRTFPRTSSSAFRRRRNSGNEVSRTTYGWLSTKASFALPTQLSRVRICWPLVNDRTLQKSFCDYRLATFKSSNDNSNGFFTGKRKCNLLYFLNLDLRLRSHLVT